MAFALNATGAAAYSICQKPLIESGFKAIFLTAFAMTSAFLPMTVLVVYTIIHDSSRYNDFIPESRQIIALFYCAIGISVVGYAAISYVLSYTFQYTYTSTQEQQQQIFESIFGCHSGEYVLDIATRIDSFSIADIGYQCENVHFVESLGKHGTDFYRSVHHN